MHFYLCLLNLNNIDDYEDQKCLYELWISYDIINHLRIARQPTKIKQRSEGHYIVIFYIYSSLYSLHLTYILIFMFFPPFYLSHLQMLFSSCMSLTSYPIIRYLFAFFVWYFLQFVMPLSIPLNFILSLFIYQYH